MEGCGACLKWLVFVFNFLFFLCGAALLGVGIWVRVDGTSFMNLIGTNQIIINAVYLLIAVGAILLVIGFLGCCGAMKENKCLLLTFFIFVFVIFVVEVVAGILAFAFLPQTTLAVYGSITQFHPNASGNVSVQLISNAWNTVQAVVGCCGFNSSSNWQTLNPFFRNSTKFVPDSCCVRNRFSLDGTILNLTLCQAQNSTSQYRYQTGCEQTFQTYFWLAGGIALGFLAVELLAMIFACCLRNSIDKD